MNKPFDLEAFKRGQKALTRDGRVATFIGICEECPTQEKLIAHISWSDSITSYSLGGAYGSRNEYDYDLVSMVSRHQVLIDAWHNGAQIEGKLSPYSEWIYLQYPEWDEDKEYRIKPEVTKPTTKTVCGWMYKDGDGDWVISKTLYTDEQLALTFKSSVTKTGRSWETEV